MITHKGTATLESERLILRRLRKADAQTIYDVWAGDPEVTRFLRWNTHESVKVTRKWLSDLKRGYTRPDFYEWGIQLRQSGQLIGSISAFDSGVSGRWEIGYCIGKAYWNNGYTTEALKRVLTYLSEECGITGFRTMNATENPASGAVMIKAGFRYVEDGCYATYDGTREFSGRVYHLDL